MTISPLPAATQALLQRLDDGYAGIDPDDESKPWEPFWQGLLDDYSDDTEAEESEEAA